MGEMASNAKKQQHANTFMLRARLVDRNGALLRPTAVETIDFVLLSINGETGKVWPLGVCVLEPSDVVLDGLQNDRDWSVDACGYNFRHLLDVSAFDLTSLPRYGEVRYIIRDTNSEMSVIRFQFRGEKYD